MDSAPELRLEIDSEGYPVMSGGIRADDEDFLREIFLNIKRLNNDSRYPLISETNQKRVTLVSFDDPLVATNASLEGDKIKWSFLGGLELYSPLSDLRVDNWNRFHAYLGPNEIPSVMSSKAQARFLNELENPERLSPSPFRNSKRSDDTTRWQEAYARQETPWDMGAINPLFLKHGQCILDAGPKIFIPGAGRAHEATHFEKHGKQLILSDLSDSARSEFFKVYPQSKAHYLVEDCLEEAFSQKYTHYFDVVVENYFFVAIPPSFRNRALSTIHSILKPGAFYSGIFFLRSSEGGPPHGLSQYELKRYSEEHGFKIIDWQVSTASHPSRLHQELWVNLQKL